MAQIRTLIKDLNSTEGMTNFKSEAWKSFELVVEIFLLKNSFTKPRPTA